jgi:hypothetical protein
MMGQGRMHGRGLPGLLASAIALALLGCSGSVRTIEGEGDDEFLDGSGGTLSTGGTGGTFDPGTGGTGEEEEEVEEPYVEPECPDEEPPPVRAECDPLEPYEDCGEGYGCYPYLDYPYGEGCGHPSYGAVCAVASTGEQGDFCGDEAGYCAPGYMCVVGAAGGKRCGKICETVRDHGCPAGLICGATDIQGFGVCF